jgi:hypothetical protein
MSTSADQLVAAYLKRLDAELAGAPRTRRREVVEEISEHIDEARAGLATQGEAEIRNLLDRLGDPAEIAAEARGRPDAPRRRVAWKEIVALIMLPIGGVILPFVGWIVGVVLLWLSDRWTTGDKLIGTLLVPGGLMGAGAFSLAGTSASGCHAPVGRSLSCPDSGPSLLKVSLFVALFLLPVITTVFLAWRLRRPLPVELA